MSNPNNLPASDMARARANPGGVIDSSGFPLLFINTTRVNPDTYEITYGETGFYQGQGNAGGNWYDGDGNFVEFRDNKKDNSLTYFLIASALITAGVSLYGSPAFGTATASEIAATGGGVFNPALDSQLANVAINNAGGNALLGYTGFELTATNAAIPTISGVTASSFASTAAKAATSAAPAATQAGTIASTAAKVVAGVSTLLAGGKAPTQNNGQTINPLGLPTNQTSANIAGIPMPLILGALALAVFA